MKKDLQNTLIDMWIAVQSNFGFECVVGDDLNWVCDKASISEVLVKDKYVEGMRVEVWNGERMWVVEQADVSRVQFVINSHLIMRQSKF
jgi:hypothetical protein